MSAIQNFSAIEVLTFNGLLLHRSFGQAYGYAASKLLAIQNHPSKARRNPENYKYFAEVEYARKRGWGLLAEGRALSVFYKGKVWERWIWFRFFRSYESP